MAKTPKWTFLGLAAILAVVLFAFGFDTLNSSSHKKSSQAYISAPVVGDMYEVELDNSEFSVMKVAALTADSVYFVHHEYNTERKDGIADLLKTYPEDFFPQEEGMDAYTREKLLELFADGEILKVSRTAVVE